jgi:hypothetical protein
MKHCHITGAIPEIKSPSLVQMKTKHGLTASLEASTTPWIFYEVAEADMPGTSGLMEYA